MHLDIKAIGTQLTAALKEYIEERIGGLSHFLGSKEGPVSAVVEVGRNTAHHRKDHVLFARVNLRLGGKILRAEASSGDIRASVDLVRGELYGEITKFKKRHRTLLRRGARSLKKSLHISPLARFRKSKIEA